MGLVCSKWQMIINTVFSFCAFYSKWASNSSFQPIFIILLFDTDELSSFAFWST